MGQSMINTVHYIYWGRKDQPVPLMKIGMTARLDSRITNVGIALEAVVACVSRKDSHRVENTARRFIRRLGGVSQQWEKDWFLFNDEIYRLVKERLLSGEIHQIAGVEFVRTGRMDEMERAAYLQRIKELEEENTRLRIQLGEIPVSVDNRIARIVWADKKQRKIVEAQEQQERDDALDAVVNATKDNVAEDQKL